MEPMDIDYLSVNMACIDIGFIDFLQIWGKNRYFRVSCLARTILLCDLSLERSWS